VPYTYWNMQFRLAMPRSTMARVIKNATLS
jgi:hypothetical protein